MRGVYFSANDAVLPWAKAFLRSFREFNPDLPLTLIPFREDCRRLNKLTDEFRFDRFEDVDGFARLEAIGYALELGHSPTGPHWFRRYASFWGPYEEFLYLDVRQIILANLTPFLEAPACFDLDFVYHDVAINQVYEPGPLRQNFLRQHQGRGFLSGLWASRRGLFSLDEFEDYGVKAVAQRRELNPRNTDQAFINYCCDTKAVRTGHFAEWDGDYVQIGWAGQPGSPYQDHEGVWRLWDYGGLDHKKRLLLLHWAGYPLQPWVPHYGLLRRFGAVPPFSGILTGQCQRLLRRIRANRWVNETFHRFRV